MGSVLLDDRTGRIEVTVFSELYETARALLVPDQFITVTGSLSFDDLRNDWTFRAEDVRIFEQARDAPLKQLRRLLGNEAVAVSYQRGTLPAMPVEAERPKAARLTVVR